MVELHKIEERILWLENLRKSFPGEIVSSEAYRSMLRSDGGKLLTINVIEKYIKLLEEITKNQKDELFYENRGRLKTFDWLLNFIKESSMDSKKEV